MGPQRIIRNGFAVAALLATAACSHMGEPVQEAGYAAAAHSAQSLPGRAVVALPALLGLSVDALAQHLGPPRPLPVSVRAILSQLPSADPADSMRYFQYRNLHVLVSYDAGTRRFNNLLLLGRNEDLLMQRAGLSAEAANYLLLPLFHARHPTQLLGLQVVPINPKKLQ